MMAGSPCRYYRLTDLLRLPFSAYDDTVDVPPASLDPEHKPRLLSQPTSISDAVLLGGPGGNCTTVFWCCCVECDRSDAPVATFHKTFHKYN